jgi:hypothetical protein
LLRKSLRKAALRRPFFLSSPKTQAARYWFAFCRNEPNLWEEGDGFWSSVTLAELCHSGSDLNGEAVFAWHRWLCRSRPSPGFLQALKYTGFEFIQVLDSGI